MKIILDDLTHPKVLDLLQAHLDGMHENSPTEHVHALDVSGLKTPDIRFWTVWEGDSVLGCGALKQLSAKHGEIKSMRTDVSYLRRGVAAKMLQHIISTAKKRGYSQLSLETGHGSAFEPALKLYRKYGFRNGIAFGGYVPNDFSQFLHLYIEA